MISKLDFFEGSSLQSSVSVTGLVDAQRFQGAIERRLCALGHSAVVESASNGTLGVCFTGEIDRTTRFLKTHLAGERARANLEKEADVLARLYGDAVLLDRFEFEPDQGDTRLCLLMALLSTPHAPASAEDVALMMRSYTADLEAFSRADLPTGWDFESLLRRGAAAIASLQDRGLVDSSVRADLDRHLDVLRLSLGGLPRALCHGDLGPKNILSDGSCLVAIDWEDAFWGVVGYDYLYWLTFVDNRPHLKSAPFGQTGLARDIEHAILCLVVALKCWLSVCSGAFRSHAIPIEARLSEVLALDGRP